MKGATSLLVFVLAVGCAAPPTLSPAPPVTVTIARATGSAPAPPVVERPADLILVLDASGSMRAFAEGDATRFDVARDVAIDIMSRYAASRVRIVLFATDAYVMAPSVLDHETLAMHLRHIAIGDIDAESTSYGEGLLTAIHQLSPEGDARAVIVLLTDGNSGAESLEAPSAKAAIDEARALKNRGARFVILQVADDNQPFVDTGRDIFNRPRRMRVPFPTDRALMGALAEAGGGDWVTVTDRVGRDTAISALLPGK